MKAPLNRPPEVSALRIDLEQRGWGLAELASATGLDRRHLSNLMANGFRSQRSRLLVENALGTPIWSSPLEFTEGQKFRRLFGFDPRLHSCQQLRSLARKWGVAGYRSVDSKMPLIKILAAHILNSPTPPVPTVL